MDNEPLRRRRRERQHNVDMNIHEREREQSEAECIVSPSGIALEDEQQGRRNEEHILVARHGAARIVQFFSYDSTFCLADN